jgi:hypothetical protein
VRNGEREVFEEWLVGVMCRVLLQLRDRMIGDGHGGVKSGTALHFRQWVIVVKELLRAEVAVLVFDPIRMIEAARDGTAVDVPLAGMIRTIAGGLQHFREQVCPGGALATVSTVYLRAAWDCIATNLLCVVSGEQRAARRPAARGVIELQKLQAILSEAIEIWRCNFTPVTAEVGIAQVISEDDQNVRPRGRRRNGSKGKRDERERSKYCDRAVHVSQQSECFWG